MTTACAVADIAPVASSCEHEPLIRNYKGFDKVFGIEVEIPQSQFEDAIQGCMWCLAPVSSIKRTIRDLCRFVLRGYLNVKNNRGESWTEPGEVPAFQEVFSALLLFEKDFDLDGIDEVVIYWTENWFGVSCYKRYPADE